MDVVSSENQGDGCNGEKEDTGEEKPYFRAWVAYILWFFGGIIGLHHLYLHRPRHSFIWFVTWGGMVVGWLTEVSRIPLYLEEANQTTEFKKRMKEIRSKSAKPQFSIFLFLSSLMIGNQLATVCVNAVPVYYTTETVYGPYLAHILAAIGASIGVNLSANIGPQESPFWQPCLAAMCTFPASYFIMHQRPAINILCILVATFISCEFATWARPRKTSGWRTYVKMTAVLSVAAVIYGALYGSNLYHNFTVNSLNGTRIPFRDAAANFMKTQPWDDAQAAMWDFFSCVQMYPLDMCQNQFLGTLTELGDPNKYSWALGVLEFEQHPTQKEIANRCRKMSRQWHPDKQRNVNGEERQAAESKFLDVQRACGVLNKIKMSRERKNIWSNPTDDVTDDVINTGSGSEEESEQYERSDDDELEHRDDDDYAQEENEEEEDEEEEDEQELHMVNDQTKESVCTKDSCEEIKS